ncbi:uncharacterized protein LOC134830635 [Culicoides brevitarsis]|uniref:uncharacterized protein LOC134830635 n=1 Tax=Culicoides brevitarsis TaxID=469753 RepID=UPI00307B19E3
MEEEEEGDEALFRYFAKLPWNKHIPQDEEERAKFYDVTFEDEKDIFYAHLNEIDQGIAEMVDQETKFSQPKFIYIDPRNGREAKFAEIWIEECLKPPWLYKGFPTKSTLTAAEHAVCIKALRGDTSEEILQQYESLKEKIAEERKKYNEFVKSYFMTNSMRRKKEIDPHLSELFAGKWKREVECFKEIRVDLLSQSFSLATAIPLKFVQLNSISVTVSTQKAAKPSPKTLFSHDVIKQRIKGAPYHLEKYYEALDPHLSVSETDPVPENFDASLPISSVVYLMQGYYDESDDWMLPITISDDGLRTQIKIDRNLPSIKLGSIYRNSNIALDVVRASFIFNGMRTSDPEEEVSTKMSEKSYEIKKFEQFIEEFSKKVAINDKKDDSQVLHAVEMTSNNNDTLSIMLSCQPDVVLDNKIVIFSPKLEYQPEFGEEQMTEHELIREYVHLKFMNNVVVKRIRLHFANYWIYSVRDITLDTVVADLHRLYQIQEADLLTSFFQLISMLKAFPPARYLGKHDPSKKEKILIYQQQDKENPNCINLGKIFSDINFSANSLDELSWTPIDVERVAEIHIRSKVAPGLFPFYGKHFRKEIKDIKKLPKPTNAKIDLLKSGTKKKKKKKKNKKKKSVAKTVSTEESFDPTELFDASGNINIFSILQPKPGTSKSSEQQMPEMTPKKRSPEENLLKTPDSVKKRILDSPSPTQSSLETTPEMGIQRLNLKKNDDSDENSPCSNDRILRNRTISISDANK